MIQQTIRCESTHRRCYASFLYAGMTLILAERMCERRRLRSRSKNIYDATLHDVVITRHSVVVAHDAEGATSQQNPKG